MTSIPPYAQTPRPVPLEIAPCCNAGCDLKDRAIAAAEAFVFAEGDDSYNALRDALRAYREWRERP